MLHMDSLQGRHSCPGKGSKAGKSRKRIVAVVENDRRQEQQNSNN